MKRTNRFAALLLAALMPLSLAACGGSGDGGNTGGDGGSSNSGGKADPLVTAMANMEKAESMDAKMVMEMDMEAGGETMETVTTMDMSIFNSPTRLKADMTMNMSGYGDVSLEIYAEETDGQLMMYTYDGTNWYSETATTEDLSQYDVGSSMDYYWNSTTGFKQEGTEQMEGVSAYKYTGVITGDAMQEVIMDSGSLDSLTQLGMDEAQLKDMLSEMGDISVNLWINEETLYPVRYEMDMTAVMDGLMGKILESMGDEAEGLTMSVPKMTISITCSNFNSATDFTIPEEAKNA
ncbi:MAG: hypothetical protein K2O18_14565 [Oscillospiraceae bacterium]|nr:hypothetical protein [Oscillospiraceae bacterium]